MTRQSSALPYAVSALAGLAICLAVTLITGRKEAWDSSLYFLASIPAMCVVIFALAWFYPQRAWRWTLSMALGQSIAIAMSGNSASMWPLAIVAMTICSLPQFIAGLIASRWAQSRKTKRP